MNLERRGILRRPSPAHEQCVSSVLSSQSRGVSIQNFHMFCLVSSSWSPCNKSWTVLVYKNMTGFCRLTWYCMIVSNLLTSLEKFLEIPWHFLQKQSHCLRTEFVPVPSLCLAPISSFSLAMVRFPRTVLSRNRGAPLPTSFLPWGKWPFCPNK